MKREPSAPLLQAIDRYLGDGAPAGGPLRMHVPGHKGGRGAPPELVRRWGPGLFRDDLTEVPGLDDLAAPRGVIAESQNRAAAILGAAAAYYLVQGSTGGIVALLTGAARSLGVKTVILPRLAHRSLVSAAVVSGVHPVFVPVAFSGGLPCGLDLEAAERALRSAGPGTAVFDLYPNMHGVAHCLSAVAALCRKHRTPLFVDAAHAGLFGRHPGLPPGPLECGADAAVFSAHKTMGSLGQSSLLLVGAGAPRRLKEGLEAALMITQTTSPSYPLLLSLETAVEHLASQEGNRRLGAALGAAGWARGQLESIGLSLLPGELPPGAAQDPLRLVMDGWSIGASGYGLADGLRGRGRVQVEAADWRSVVVVFGLGDGPDTAEALAGGIRAVCGGGDPAAQGSAGRPVLQVCPYLLRVQELYERLAVGPWDVGLEPRAAWFLPGQLVRLEAAGGSLACEPLSPYPPGVPVVWPGERISADHIELLQAILDLGGSVQGLYPGGRAEETGWLVRVAAERGA